MLHQWKWCAFKAPELGLQVSHDILEPRLFDSSFKESTIQFGQSKAVVHNQETTCKEEILQYIPLWTTQI